jgi:hypothetical protein
MKNKRQNPKPQSKRQTTGAWPLRSWITGVLILGLVPLIELIPTYQTRIGPGLKQFRQIHKRVRWPLDDVRALLKPKAFPPLQLIRDETFTDAVVVVTDDPRDAPLNNLSWCAYYIYPRIVVNTDMLKRDPTIQPDFLLTTPNFPANFPDSARVYSMSALSARADEHIRARKPQ